jgi:hypothetical protein
VGIAEWVVSHAQPGLVRRAIPKPVKHLPKCAGLANQNSNVAATVNRALAIHAQGTRGGISLGGGGGGFQFGPIPNESGIARAGPASRIPVLPLNLALGFVRPPTRRSWPMIGHSGRFSQWFEQAGGRAFPPMLEVSAAPRGQRVAALLGA